MAAKILDGKALAADILSQVAAEVEAFEGQFSRAPGLAVLLVGENPASKVYVKSKTKTAESCGIKVIDVLLPGDVKQEFLLSEIRALNERDDVDGILLQLPLPKGLSEFEAISFLAPEKDVDGLHPFNQGLLMRGRNCLRPCTPLGCVSLIKKARSMLGQDQNLSGLRAVIVGRSLLVGKPSGQLLLEENCTVTICHSKSTELETECARADILVAAIGRPQMVSTRHIKPGAIVIDVGINRTPEGKLVGDVDFSSVAEIAGAITPVPGGAGPMTIAMLMKNTVQAARDRAHIK